MEPNGTDEGTVGEAQSAGSGAQEAAPNPVERGGVGGADAGPPGFPVLADALVIERLRAAQRETFAAIGVAETNHRLYVKPLMDRVEFIEREINALQGATK